MPHYRLYALTAESRITKPPQVVECDSDEDAILKAQQLVNGADVEVWDGERLVVRLPHY